MEFVSRNSWKIRNRFSDWLWHQVANGNRTLKLIGRVLPWYLSDPDAHYYRKKMKDPDWWDSLEPVKVTGPPTMRIIDGTAYYRDVKGHPLMVQAYIDANEPRTWTGVSHGVR